MKLTPEKFLPLPIKDFAKKVICDGHLYLCTKEGRKFYLMKPGILVDPEFVKKHATLNTTFNFVPVTDMQVTQKFLTLFKELKYLHFEKDLRLKSKEIVDYFKDVHSDRQHFLSFTSACLEEFCGVGKDHLLKMHETDLHLLRKSIYSAAFSIILALSNDFFHYPVLKDLYNLTLSLDIGLCGEHYSYYVAEACNQENQNPGSGRFWLDNEKATDNEINLFLSHPEKTYAFLKAQPQLFSYPELIEVALYQHELSLGQGFPRGIPKGQVSSWEAVVVLSDALFEIRDEYDFEDKILEHFFNFQNSKLADLPVHRVFQKACMALGHVYKVKATGT